MVRRIILIAALAALASVIPIGGVVAELPPGGTFTDDNGSTHEPDIEAIAAEIQYDDFARLDLRVARIIAANHVDKSDKLLQLTLDLGNETRNVFAGIATAYEPETLTDKLVIMVANLAHRKMRFGVSEGMVLCAGDDDTGLFLLNPDPGATPGMRVS